MNRLAALLCAGLVLAAAPALAATATIGAAPSRAFAAPAQLSSAERDAYRAIFAALRARDWAGAAGRLDAMRPGRCTISPAPSSTPCRARRASRRGRSSSCSAARRTCRRRPLSGPPRGSARRRRACPPFPPPERLYGLPGQPRRARPRPIRGDAAADQLEPLIQPLIVDDKPVEAEASARHAQRRADGRGADRVPAAHRLGLLSQRQ